MATHSRIAMNLLIRMFKLLKKMSIRNKNLHSLSNFNFYKKNSYENEMTKGLGLISA